MHLLDPQTLDYASRLVVATILGLAIGIEREFSHRSAGLRTCTLVSIGSALFTILGSGVAVSLFGINHTDPSHVVEQIVVGVGFLGAGMIIFQHEKVANLTTAAAIWVTSAIGAAAGLKAYGIAVVATLLMLFVLLVLRWCEMLLHLREPSQMN